MSHLLQSGARVSGGPRVHESGAAIVDAEAPAPALGRAPRRRLKMAQKAVKSSRLAVPGFRSLCRPVIRFDVAADPNARWTVAGEAAGKDWR